jgi:NADPH:quinone reductase-like Zn-dependent oxidoreductase
MRAVIFEHSGPPDVLQLRELPAPSPAAGQVLIRVAYAGVNYAEVMFRRGDLACRARPAAVKTGRGVTVRASARPATSRRRARGPRRRRSSP